MFVLRLFGFEVLALGSDVHADEPDPGVWGGYTGGEFERDTEPLRANREEPLEWENKLGFS